MRKFVLPLAIFMVIAVFLAIGLRLDPRKVPSTLIDKPAPPFTLPSLLNPAEQVSSDSLKGKPWLLNVWGTWCAECWREHGFLVSIAKQGVTLVGINWRDDAQDAKKMLSDRGNPFVMVGFDPDSSAIIDWGVYGAPETFVIDAKGIVRKRYEGALSPTTWEAEIAPLWRELTGQVR